MAETKAVEDKVLPRKRGYKIKVCRVIEYNPITHKLDIDFNGYGIRLYNVQDFSGNKAKVRYRGEIGKTDFVCEYVS